VFKPRIKSMLSRLARAAPLLIAAALAFGPMSGCYARVRPAGYYYGGGGYYRAPNRYYYPRERYRYYRAPDPYYRGYGRHHHHHHRHHHHPRW